MIVDMVVLCNVRHLISTQLEPNFLIKLIINIKFYNSNGR